MPELAINDVVRLVEDYRKPDAYYPKGTLAVVDSLSSEFGLISLCVPGHDATHCVPVVESTQLDLVRKGEPAPPKNDWFEFHDGRRVGTIAMLRGVLAGGTTRGQEAFAAHVTSTRNEIADWVESIVREQESATALRKATTREAAVAILDKLIVAYIEGRFTPPVTPETAAPNDRVQNRSDQTPSIDPNQLWKANDMPTQGTGVEVGDIVELTEPLVDSDVSFAAGTRAFVVSDTGGNSMLLTEQSALRGNLVFADDCNLRVIQKPKCIPPEGDRLEFANGRRVQSIVDLYTVLSDPLSGALEFDRYVSRHRNEIADWIIEVLREEELSKTLRTCKDVEQVQVVLRNHLLHLLCESQSFDDGDQCDSARELQPSVDDGCDECGEFASEPPDQDNEQDTDGTLEEASGFADPVDEPVSQNHRLSAKWSNASEGVRREAGFIAIFSTSPALVRDCARDQLDCFLLETTTMLRERFSRDCSIAFPESLSISAIVFPPGFGQREVTRELRVMARDLLYCTNAKMRVDERSNHLQGFFVGLRDLRQPLRLEHGCGKCGAAVDLAGKQISNIQTIVCQNKDCAATNEIESLNALPLQVNPVTWFDNGSLGKVKLKPSAAPNNGTSFRSKNQRVHPQVTDTVTGPKAPKRTFFALLENAQRRMFPQLDLGDGVDIAADEGEWLRFIVNAHPDYLDIARKALASLPSPAHVTPKYSSLIWNLDAARAQLPKLVKALPVESESEVAKFWDYPLQHVEGIISATNVMIEKLEAEGALIRKEMSGVKGLEYAAEVRTGRPRGLTITLWRKFADGAVDGIPHIVSRTGPDAFVIGVCPIY